MQDYEMRLFYICAFVLVMQIVLIVLAIIRKIKWRWPLATEVLSVTGILYYIQYYEKHPRQRSGYILLEGFGEAIVISFSLIAYIIVLLISLLLYAVFSDREMR